MPDTNIQLEIFPTSLRLRRIDPTQNMRRYYGMYIQPDLFGGASLVRCWGRIGTRGRQLIDSHDDEGSAVSALIEMSNKKRRRGYTP